MKKAKAQKKKTSKKVVSKNGQRNSNPITTTTIKKELTETIENDNDCDVVVNIKCEIPYEDESNLSKDSRDENHTTASGSNKVIIKSEIPRDSPNENDCDIVEKITTASESNKVIIKSEPSHDLSSDVANNTSSNYDILKLQFEDDDSYPYTCKVCYRTFETMRLRNIHFSRMHATDVKKRKVRDTTFAPYECRHCKSRFWTIKRRIQHWRITHNFRNKSAIKKPIPIQERKNKKKFVHQYENDKFIAQRMSELECPLCKMSVPDFKILQNHFFEQHFGQKCYISCCNKKFFQRSHIVLHLKLHEDPQEQDRFIRNRMGDLECPLCNISSLNYSLLSEHFGEKHLEKNCHIICCGQQLFERSQIVDHLNEHHDSVPPPSVKGEIRPSLKCDNLIAQHLKQLECPLCKYTCENFHKLIFHFSLQHPGENAHLICCNCKFFRRTDLVKHLEKHHENLTHRKGKILMAQNFKELQCPLCETTCENFNQMKRHFNLKHPGERGYIICCNRKFLSRCDLVKHLEKHSDGNITIAQETRLEREEFIRNSIGELQCPLCKSSRATFTELTKHFKQEHPQENCHVICCGQKLSYVSLLVQHIRTHKDKKDYDLGELQCPLCNVRVAKYSKLKLHFKKEHPSEKCHIACCDLKFIDGARIIQHLKKHKRIESAKTENDKYDAFIAKWMGQLECPLCKISFTNYGKLSEHFQNKHIQDRCHIMCCSHKYYSRFLIVNHLKLHMNTNKQYQCEKCSFVNSSSSQVKRHMRLTHGYQKRFHSTTTSFRKHQHRHIERFGNEKLTAKWKGNLECPLCNRFLRNYTLLKIHFHVGHSTEKCHIICCNSKLFSLHQIVDHLRQMHVKRGMEKSRYENINMTSIEEVKVKYERDETSNNNNITPSICEQIQLSALDINDMIKEESVATPSTSLAASTNHVARLSNAHELLNQVEVTRLIASKQIQLPDLDFKDIIKNESVATPSTSLAANTNQIELAGIVNVQNNEFLKTASGCNQIQLPVLELEDMIIKNEIVATPSTSHIGNTNPIDFARLINIQNGEFSNLVTVPNQTQIEDESLKNKTGNTACSIGPTRLNNNNNLKKKENDEFLAKWKSVLQCPLCQDNFTNYALLQTRDERYFHTGDLITVIEKSLVTAVINYVNRSHLVDHLQIHVDPMAFKCKLCDKIFRCAIGLRRHIEHVHPNECTQLYCPHCKRSFKSDKNFNRHMSSIHKGDDMQNREGQLENSTSHQVEQTTNDIVLHEDQRSFLNSSAINILDETSSSSRNIMFLELKTEMDPANSSNIKYEILPSSCSTIVSKEEDKFIVEQIQVKQEKYEIQCPSTSADVIYDNNHISNLNIIDVLTRNPTPFEDNTTTSNN